MTKKSDKRKTKAQLIEELLALRQRVAELQEPEQPRRRTEQVLRESEEKYRTILENIEEAYYEVDLAGNFAFFNDALCGMLGYTKDELLGMNNRQYMDEVNAKQVLQTFNAVYRTGESAQAFDWEIIRKDGARRFVEASVSLLSDSASEPVGFHGIVRDVTERKQAETEIIKLNRELATLNSVGRALISALDMEETLTIITDHTTRLLGVEAASVILRDEAKGDLWFAAASGEGSDFVLSVRLPLGQGIVGWVIQHGEAVMVPDVSQDARWFSDFDKESGLTTRSILCVPLQAKGQTIGAIEVMNKESGAFDEEDLRLLTSLAVPAATAIENARLFEQSRIHVDELAVLNELGQALTARLNVEEVLDEAYRGISRLMDTTNFYIALYEPDKDEVTFALDVLEGKVRKPYSTRKAGYGLTEHIIRNRSPLLIEEDIPERLEELEIEPIGRVALSWLGVPLIVGGRVLGVMAVQSYTTPRLYGVGDLDLLTAIASQAAIAIQNARSYEQSQARAKELAVLNELSQALTARLSVEDVLEEAYRGAARLVDTTNFFIGLYDPQKDEVAVPFVVSESEIDRQITTIPANQGFTGYIIRNCASVLVEENVTAWLEERGIDMVGDPACSWLGVPLVVGDQVLGVMAVQSYTTPRLYGEHDRDLLTAIAGPTAIAIQNARLYEQARREIAERKRAEAEVRRRAEQAALTYKVGQRVSSELELDELLSQIVTVVRDAFDYYGVMLLLLEEETERLTLRSVAGGYAGAPPIELELAVGEGMIGHAAATGKAQVSNDVSKNPYYVRKAGEETKSELVVPIKSGRKVIGVLDLQSSELDAFDETDVLLMETLADQVGVAIENARLYEQVQQRLQEQTMLFDVSQRLADAPLQVEEIAEVAVRQFTQVMEAAECSLSLLDPQGDTLQTLADFWIEDRAIHRDDEHQESFRLSDYPATARVMETLQPLVVQASDPDADPHELAYMRQDEAATLAIVPLVAKGQVVGVIELELWEEHHYTPEQLNLAMTLANQVAGALENARLYEEIQRELAERKRVEDALQESEEKYRTIIENIEDGYYEVDIAGNFVFLTDPLGRTLGYPEDELMGMNNRQYMDDENAKAVYQAYNTVYRTGEPAKAVGYEIIGKDGTKRFVESSVSLVRDSAGEPVGFRGVLRDVTERRRTAEALQKAHEELEKYTTLLERQTARLRVGAEVAREVSAILDVHQLLAETVRLISNEFGFYHAAVFMVGEPGEYAILRAASSSGGRRMLQQDYRVPVGKTGVVGYVAATGEYRIALDVGENAISFNNPDLPDTHSEIALPLRMRGRTIGVLDIQSTQEAAFSKGDVAGLQTLADQLAVSIENARLVERTEAQLREMGRLYGEYSAAAWADLLSPARPLGYVYDRVDVLPVAESPPPALALALEHGEASTSDESEVTGTMLTMPLKLRGQTIGVLGVQEGDGAREWSPEEIAIVEAVSDQVAMALDSARLFGEARTHAEELVVLNELAQSLTARLAVEEVLEETYQGVSQLLDTTNFYAALYDPDSDSISFPVAFEDGQPVDWRPRRAGQGLTEHIVRSRQPLLMQERVPERMKELGIEMIGSPALSWLGVPLLIGDRVLGMMAAQSYTTPRLYGEHDRDLLTAIASQAAIALQNARLFEQTEAALAETERLAQELTVLNELGQALTAQLNVDQVLEEAYRQASRLLDTTNFCIGLYDPEREMMDIVFQVSESEIDRQLESVPVSGSVSGYIIRNRTSVLTGENPAEELEQMGLEMVGEPDVSWLGVPLLIGDRALGVMDLQSFTIPNLYDEHDRDLLTAIASPVAIALQNARLFEDTESRLAQVTALQETTRAVASTLELDKLLDLIIQQATTLLQGDGGIVNLVDWENSEDEVVAASGSAAHTLGYHSPLEGSLSGWVTLHNQPVISNQLQNDSRAAPRWRSGEEQDQSAAVAPLTIKDQVIGTLVVMNKQGGKGEFDQADLDLLVAFGNQAATAIQNARLFEETQRRATQLAAAAEVARDATAILEVEQLLDETVHLISEQFGYYHAGVFLLDEQDEYAVLQAASSEGGRRMLERGHKLKVGEVGIVGYAAATGEPRIALDVDQDAAHFAHDDLPATRSEMGLPLKVRERVIGVLDVQSDQAAAFFEGDVSALQTMADQLATAIANARLFQEARTDARQRALINEMLQAAAKALEPEELLHQAGEIISLRLEAPSALFDWETQGETLRTVAVHGSDAADVSLPEAFRQMTRLVNPVLFEAAEKRRTTVLEMTSGVSGPLVAAAEQSQAQSVIYVPLVSRDQVLGVFGIARLEGQTLVDVEFAELVAANLSVAVESTRLYQEAVQTAERLEELDRLKSQFLANMSHELRTPLNSIIGFSRVILKEIDGPLTDMQRTDLQAVYDSGQHLLGLINDILEVAKIESGTMELTFEPVDLKEIVRGVMATAIALVKDKPGIKLQQSVPQDLPTVIGDTRRVRQAVLNLVSNAAKFTEEGFIRVEVAATDTEVIISVADSGIGIPPDKTEMIFEPFTQADASTTREAGGTGLGLSITNSFVRMHGGRMWVESELDKGSTFYMALPIQGPPVPEKEVVVVKEEEWPEPGEPGQKIVLCVEDDEGVITLFRRYLSKQGYRIIGLTNSATVVERARELEPFAITLDVMMPGKDGWQVIQELKSDPETSHIPVIMCTIVGEKEYGLSLGAADYLVKPILEQDLLAALRRLDREVGQHLVLVVDDQPEDRSLLRRILEAQEGYEVMEAGGGREAIDLIRQRPPHVIILDLMMPNVDGFAVLEAVKTDKSTRSIPIIVVTAKELTRDEQQALNSGVEALLQKGIFEQQELLADVAAALERLGRGGRRRTKR